MKRCRLSTGTAIKVYNYRGVMKKNTNIGIYVRYSENMDTWKMSEKSLKTIDITANKRYNRYIKINVLGLVLSTAVTRYGCRGLRQAPGRGIICRIKSKKRQKYRLYF